MKKKNTEITLHDNIDAARRRVLLHSCCAPCSSAILEFFLQHDIKPTVFYSNSNIYPIAEYQHRRNEIERHLAEMGIPFVEDEYNHDEWLAYVKGLETAPERGMRCLQCFKYRLQRTAAYAHNHGFALFTTTLASSRWKSLQQIDQAGQWAALNTQGAGELDFWNQNWRKGGLQERRNALLRKYGFYNQQYCGCEFSMRTKNEK